MYAKNAHCSYCGQLFKPEHPWPRTCEYCRNTSFVNPLPVAVVLVPVDGGLLAIRRGVAPRQGMLALPGGFIDVGESWQAAGAREVFEETGVTIDPAAIRDVRALSAPDGTVLIFGIAPPLAAAELPPFAPHAEASERVILGEPAELAFPLHTQVVREYFAGRAA